MPKVITEIKRQKKVHKTGTRVGIGIKRCKIFDSTALDHLASLPVIFSNEQALGSNRAHGKSTECISTRSDISVSKLSTEHHLPVFLPQNT